MDKETQKKILPRIRGELENYAKDVVDYYQKTGLVIPSNLEIYAKRITELGYRKPPKGKPPLLSDKEIVLREVRIPTGDSIGSKPVVRVEKEIDIDATLQAQREADIKFYTSK